MDHGPVIRAASAWKELLKASFSGEGHVTSGMKRVFAARFSGCRYHAMKMDSCGSLPQKHPLDTHSEDARCLRQPVTGRMDQGEVWRGEGAQHQGSHNVGQRQTLEKPSTLTITDTSGLMSLWKRTLWHLVILQRHKYLMVLERKYVNILQKDSRNTAKPMVCQCPRNQEVCCVV